MMMDGTPVPSPGGGCNVYRVHWCAGYVKSSECLLHLKIRNSGPKIFKQLQENSVWGEHSMNHKTISV